MQLPGEIEDVKRLALRPDDIVVLRCAHAISFDQADCIRALLRDVFGKDRQILILDRGMTLDVLDPADLPEREVVR